MSLSRYDLSKIKTKTFSNSGPYALGEEVNEFIKKEIEPRALRIH